MTNLIALPTPCHLDEDFSVRMGALADRAMALIEAKALPNWMIDHVTDELSWLLKQWSAAGDGRPVNAITVQIRFETLEGLLARVGREEVFHCMMADPSTGERGQRRVGLAPILTFLICASVFVFLFVAVPLAFDLDSRALSVADSTARGWDTPHTSAVVGSDTPRQRTDGNDPAVDVRPVTAENAGSRFPHRASPSGGLPWSD